jgi:putative phosphoserine phosphatase/1-acylglycerol-3-phosphate O-acyltransferase
VDTDALLAQIRNGPQGPRIGAFLDFGGTIIDGYSASTLYEHRFRARELGLDEAVRALKAARGGPTTEQKFETFLTAAVSGWTGRP